MFKDFSDTFPEFDAPARQQNEIAKSRQPFKRRQPLLFLPADDTERVLALAQGLVRRGWTKGNYATTYHDIPISHTHLYAFRFCAVGAIMRAADDYEVPRLFSRFWREYRNVKALRVMTEALGLDGRNTFDEHAEIMHWNDRSNVSEVLDGFDKAIALAKQLGVVYAWV